MREKWKRQYGLVVMAVLCLGLAACGGAEEAVESEEERIISHLAKVKNLTLEQAMDIYYSSHLAQKIHEGKDDVQYLDYKVLVQILLDTEPVDSGAHYMDA